MKFALAALSLITLAGKRKAEASMQSGGFTVESRLDFGSP